MKLRILGIGIFLTLTVSACSTDAPPAPASPRAKQTPHILSTVTQADSTLIPETSTPDTPTPGASSSPDPSPLPVITCPASADYAWAYTYLPNSSYIGQILPAPDGSYYIAGGIRGISGDWLAKISPDGQVLWQNLYASNGGTVQIDTENNLLLQNSSRALTINPETGVLMRGWDASGYVHHPDGGFTTVYNGQAARYKDPQTLIWQFSAKDLKADSIATSDGGAIFAYVGQYADTSHYMRPIYTDIKVIKVTGTGEVLQHVYGKLVGDETLDYSQPTGDGGALLVGTHAYEDLGSDYDIWLMKLNASGNISWQSTLKLAPNIEYFRQIFTLENGYLVVTEVDYDGTLTLVQLKPSGSLNWQKTILSARGPLNISTASNTPEGGLLLAGETSEKNSIYWLARLDPRGNLLWEKTLGYDGIPGTSSTEVVTMLAAGNGKILLGGYANLLGEAIVEQPSAWIAKIADSGQPLGLLKLSPGKFNISTTLGRRPNTLADEIYNTASLTPGQEIKDPPLPVTLQSYPVCLPAGIVFPTPASLPTLTPTITPTPTFVRDLYLNNPPMQGDDVLKLQQRLLELGYAEVGAPDGIFGTMTREAVRRFQERNTLTVDGYVGPKTWARLFSPNALRGD